MNINDINALPFNEAKTRFFDICHCERWAEAMCHERPFNSDATCFKTAQQLWNNASEAEILESTLGHKRIGDLEALRNKYSQNTQQEQGQVLQAPEEVLVKLHQLNNAYYKKFGFIFIVCATGKPASEMLRLIEQRIVNSREQEIQQILVEQAKITHIRLQKLLEPA